MSKIAIIGGARPNFMKIAPLARAFERERIPYFIVNTGQHFDKDMSDNFFQEFGLRPDYHVAPSKTSVVKQFSDILSGIENIFSDEAPKAVIVVGDVNSTLAGALAANKMGIPLAHVEAGFRSFNKKMPEEFNRTLTDHLSDYLFATSDDGVENLRRENIHDHVYVVGNVMIDTVVHFLPTIGATEEQFYYCTLHRSENVDSEKNFTEIVRALEVIGRDAKIYLPLHPRTAKMARAFHLLQ